MSQILGIKFSDHGPVCYFASGAHVVRAGQSVLVETDQGLALGHVATVAAPEVVQQDAHIVVAAADSNAADSAPAAFEAVLGGADWQDEGSPAELTPASAGEPAPEQPHEPEMIGAIGNCGQVCCCRRFLRKFAPVTIKMAKEQNLFLNPAKISGICGRLLCCLSYEQKGYEEFHKQCPKIGKRIQTAIGNAKVLRANFFKKSISVWVEDLGEREFSLDEWKDLVNRQATPEGAAQAPEGQAPERQGRQGGGRPSTGRPSRPERPARAEKSDRPERPERTEPKAQADVREAAPQAVATQGANGAPAEPGAERPANAEGEAGRSRPRRKRRKGRGPKPA